MDTRSHLFAQLRTGGGKFYERILNTSSAKTRLAGSRKLPTLRNEEREVLRDEREWGRSRWNAQVRLML